MFDEFALRVLKVLFMIKHVKEMPATIDRLATLLVESINEDKVALKDKIYEALKVLEAETFMQFFQEVLNHLLKQIYGLKI